MLHIFGIIGFVFLVFVILKTRTKSGQGFIPSDFFLFFFILTWSPLCFFPLDRTHLPAVFISAPIQLRFALSYFLMCLFVGVGYLITIPCFRKLKDPMDRRMLTSFEYGKFTTLVVATSFTLICVYLASSELRTHLQNIIDYIFSKQLFSYNDSRRGVVYSGPIMGVFFPRFQYSLVLFLFVSLLVVWIRRPVFGGLLLLFAGLLFSICGTSLSKLPYLFYFVSIATCVGVWIKVRQILSWRKTIIYAGMGIISSVIIIIGLYMLQYRDNSSLGLSTFSEILVFRVGSAYPLGYKLYLEVYPDLYPYAYGRAISILQPFIGAAPQPYNVVPNHFGFMNTTFPSGFISYGYADFGWIGVIMTSFLVGVYVRFLDWFSLSRKVLEFHVLSVVVLGLGTFHLWNGPFSTALLTGGLGLNPILIMLLQSLVVQNRSRP